MVDCMFKQKWNLDVHNLKRDKIVTGQRPKVKEILGEENFTLDPTSNEIAKTTLILRSFRSFGHT